MNERTALVLFLFAVINFTQNVKPILDAHCVECHSAGSTLDLSHFPFACATTSDQRTIVDKMLSLAGTDSPQMPPGNRPKLSVAEVGTLRHWREEGLAP